MQPSVSIIGTGNVAWHLAKQFSAAGILVREIAGRTLSSIQTFAEEFQAKAVSSLQELDNQSSIYIICVNDDYIASVAQQMSHISQLVVHTSGATHINCLAAHLARVGVLYPLQTFKKQQPVDWNGIPICIELKDPSDLGLLESFATALSKNIHLISSEQRLLLHTAAVFVSNFVNYLYITAQDIVAKADLPLSLLWPLMREVTEKTKNTNPLLTQTGPAIRNDLKVQEKHLAQLTPEQSEIYVLLSQLIKQRFH